jgi:hypothetical protein
VGSLGLLSIGLEQYLRLPRARAGDGSAPSTRPAPAQACILVWLEGGPSQMDTWDPKPNSSFRSIATSVPGIRISELLPRVARHMDKLAIIRSMHTEESNHPQGSYYALTGHRPNTAMNFPSLGCMVCKETGPRNEMPQFAVVSQPWEHDPLTYMDALKGACLGGDYDPMVIPDPSKEDLHLPDLELPKTLTAQAIDDRRSFLDVVDRHYRAKEHLAEFDQMDALSKQALAMLRSPAVKRAFDLSREPDRVRDAYGRHRVGQSMLLARRLVEAGSRFVMAAGYEHGQWDTHSNNDGLLREVLAPQLDQTLSTLLADLAQRGLLESTLVLIMGEFGRTPDFNPAEGGPGRDHWPECWSLALAGGGIRGGQVIGASDAKAGYVADRMVSMGDVYASLYKALGIDWTKTYMTPIGRPIYIANALGDKQGEPIKEL